MDDLTDPNPSEEEHNKPIPFDDEETIDVSYSPLHLSSNSAAGTPNVEQINRSARGFEKKPAGKIVSSERISGVKTFFTKLHIGAIDFLDGQINDWLNDNPGVTVKRTNVTTGLIQGKKTEPNIIISVWY